MAIDSRAADVRAYAAAVRAALAELPRLEAQVLLEDLDDHLTEVAAESDEPLGQRLGAPQTYAAELRAAYGASPSRRKSPLASMRQLGSELNGWLGQSAAYREVMAFLPELRPAWWVLRGYLVVLILMAVAGLSRLVPDPVSKRGLLQLILTLGAVVISVRVGRRSGDSRPRLIPLVIASNWLIALLAIPVIASLDGGWTSGAISASTPVELVQGGSPPSPQPPAVDQQLTSPSPQATTK
jgi:hypothetical protein